MISSKIFIIFLSIHFVKLVKPISGAIENCAQFMNTHQYKGLHSLVPLMPALDVKLKYCSSMDKTCCTVEVEEKLKNMAKNDYERITKKKLFALHRMFKSKTTKFNEYFKDLLSKSKKDFHEMFKKTYGIVYEQNSYVFSDFFSELEKYFSYGKSNLADVMDTFFNILYQKMFTVMNSQYKFDDKYLGCVSEHMNELKPFGDVPQKLSLPLKRSFVAARIYSQSLNSVGDVVGNLGNLIPSENCYNAVTKMSHCSACKNVPATKVCHGLCVNVMKGCMAFYSKLDLEWNNFVDALHKVQQRLLGPFNLELVVEPINVKISEAIMNFQESAGQVSKKVFDGCGKPALSDSRRRRKRQATPRRNSDTRVIGEFVVKRRKENIWESNSNPDGNQNRNDKISKRKTSKNNNDFHSYAPSPIDGFLKFIQEIGDLVLPTKFFWKRLPYNMCSDEMNVESNRSAACWNGNTVGSNDVPEIQDGSKNQQSNQGVSVEPNRQLTIVSEQIYTLKSVSMQLRNAYNGQDVEWIDSEDTMYSGSGSGQFPDTDNFNGINSYEGSGFSEPFLKSSSSKSFESTTVSSTSHEVSVNRNSSDVNGENADNAFFTTNIESKSSISTIGYSSATETTTVISVFNVTGINTHINVTTSDGISLRCGKMSLNQAIAAYLLPTVVLWIGGSFNEWSHPFVLYFNQYWALTKYFFDVIKQMKFRT